MSQVQMPDSDSFWIIEGALKIDEKGDLGLEHDGHMISLTEALAGRSGHHVLVLVGALQEQTLID